MKTIKVTFALLCLTTLFASCGGKSPKDYADEYCECITNTDNKMSDCKGIVDEAKEEFGSDKDAAKEFADALKDCK